MSLEPSAVEIVSALEQLQAKVTEMLSRQGLLKRPTQTLEVEQELAALGREFADTVMERLLVASVEANAAAPRRRGASPPWGQEDAVNGATRNASLAPGRTANLPPHHLPSSGSHSASGQAQGKRPSRQSRGR